MPTHAFHRRAGPAQALLALAMMASAFSACGGSSASTPNGSVARTVPAAPTVSSSTAPTPTAVPSAAPSPLAALTLLWQKGGPDPLTAGTYWPAIDPSTGNVWVASSFDNQYWIFSADGKFLEAWGAPGKGPGQFQLTTNDPKPDAVGAIAFAPDGSFYVVDNGNYRVEKFDKTRQFVAMWGSFGTGEGQFANPKGIATDGKTIYVADDPRLDIQAFDTTGRFLRSFPFPFVLFSQAPTGHLFVADQTGVLELDGFGKPVGHLDVDFTAMGVYPAQTAVDKAGDIFVGLQTDTPVGLVELDSHGRILHNWSVGGETMALAPDGKSVYVASYGWDFIRKYALP